MSKILKRTSFGLVRTNPRLTTNVKLVANSSDKIFLETIDADPLLSKSIYKGFELSVKGSYSYDIKRFYSQNLSKLPEEIAYKVFEQDSSLLIKGRYNQQYDFTYGSGAYPKNSRLYSEEFAIFAPVWLERDNLPDFFVIFKMEDPVTINTANISGNLDNNPTINSLIEDPEYFFDNYVKNARIIKKFDLTEKTNLGTYIRNHINDTNFPESSLYSSFEKGIGTEWRGISYRGGGFCSIVNDIHYDYVIQDKTILESDDFITSGFKRNGVIVANILNLEFLFDDEDQEKYQFSRYFGMYVNAEELGQFLLDPVRLYNDRDAEFTQNPRPNKVFLGDPISEIDQIQTNLNGIKVYPEMGPSGIHEGRLIQFSEIQNPRFSYIEDTQGNFYSIDNKNNWDTVNTIAGPTTSFTSIDSDFLRIKNRRVNWKNFGGFENPFNFIPITPTAKIGRPGLSFRVTNTITSGDEIRIQFIDWTNLSILNLVDNHTIKADLTLPPESSNGILFSPNGTPKQIAKSISLAINAINVGTSEYTIFSSISIEDEIIIFSRVASENWNKLEITFFSSSPTFPFSTSNEYVEDVIITNYIQSPVSLSIPVAGRILRLNFTGGNSNSKSRVIIEKRYIQELRDSVDKIFVKTKKGYKTTGNPVIYLDEPIFDKFGNIINFVNFDKYLIVELSDLTDAFELGSSSKIGLYRLAKNSLGYLSILPIKDFDFDTRSTEYNRDGDASPNKLYDWYQGIGPTGASAIFDWNTIGSTAQGFITDIIGPTSAFVISGGFKRLLGVEDELIDEVKDIDTEYDRLKENLIPDLATESKVVPFINKWVYDNECVDVRENPYRLNVAAPFGYSNFSPAFDEISKNPKFYTHEWYYLQKYPPYMSIDEKINSFSYFDEDLNFPNIPRPTDLNASTIYSGLTGSTGNLLSGVEDYFVEYFTRETVDGLPIPRDFKYSLFSSGDNLRPAETLFRGSKVEVRDRSEFSAFNFDKLSKKYITSEKYNGYKFSAVLTYGIGATNITIIKNDKFRSITLVIRVDFNDPLFQYLDSNGSNQFIDRSLLYSANNRLTSTSPSFLLIADKSISGNIIDWIDNGTSFEVSMGPDLSGNLPNLINELVQNDTGGFNDISITDGTNTYVFAGISNITGSSFQCQSISGLPLFPLTITPTGSLNLVPDIVNIWFFNAPLFLLPLQTNPIYVGGGFGGYSSILDSISFSTISNLINEGNPAIRYVNVTKNGSIEFNTYSIDLIRPDYPITSEYLRAIEIKKTPSDIQTNASIIGYEITAKERISLNQISRHRGEFNPKFRDLFRFVDVNDIKAENLDYYNIQILTTLQNQNSVYLRDADIGKIKNLYFNKVNEENPKSIISDSAELGQVYPLIDEISIDFRDFFVFKSNWDVHYYRTYPKRNISNPIIGTREPREFKSFYGSKILSIPNNITIQTFPGGIINKSELVDARSINNVSASLVQSLDAIGNRDQLTVSVFTEKAISDFFIEDGIIKPFNDFVNPLFSFGDNGVSDDKRIYIKENLIDRYFIKEIIMWEREWNPRRGQVNLPQIEINLTDAQKVNSGYKPSSNFQIIGDQLGGLDFRLIYTIPKDRRTSISLTIKLEKK